MIHHSFECYLTSNDTFTLHLHYFDRAWPGTPSIVDIWNLRRDMDALAAIPKPLSQQLPHIAMWERIHMDYTPSHHPSHITCTPPSDGTLPPVTRAAASFHSHLISSTIFRFVVAHCFNANYSAHFRPHADDVTTCPCATLPRTNPRHHPHHPK